MKRNFLASISRRNEAPEFGFGTNANAANHRLLNRDGSANVVRLGDKPFNLINIYHALITMSWLRFLVYTTLFYSVVNLLFTLLYYYTCPDQVSGMVYQTEHEKFMEIFFFSAQSLTTVGYGRINPSGTLASSIAAFESFTGLLGFALATGMLYGRFSRPTAKLLYSERLLVSPYAHPVYGKEANQALMFRIANERKNQLIEVEATVIMAYDEQNDGNIQRRYQRLKLEVEKINFLAMSWTIVHPINPESPLYGLTADDLESVNAEFMVNLKAIDDTYVQQIYDRSSYKWNEMIWGARFNSILTTAPDGRTALDLRKFNDYTLQ